MSTRQITLPFRTRRVELEQNQTPTDFFSAGRTRKGDATITIVENLPERPAPRDG